LKYWDDVQRALALSGEEFLVGPEANLLVPSVTNLQLGWAVLLALVGNQSRDGVSTVTPLGGDRLVYRPASILLRCTHAMNAGTFSMLVLCILYDVCLSL